mmetsp:Transcript_18743/g.56599  ORF Transcript_18743/g.56599 Transcript_18743/m.56599 type:complete len:90 (-) Transcript_18743:980-1249(-)
MWVQCNTANQTLHLEPRARVEGGSSARRSSKALVTLRNAVGPSVQARGNVFLPSIRMRWTLSGAENGLSGMGNVRTARSPEQTDYRYDA